jgi:hypothetical protein
MERGLGLGGSVGCSRPVGGNFECSLDHPAIRYYQDPADPVTRLQKQLENGQAKPDFALNQG